MFPPYLSTAYPARLIACAGLVALLGQTQAQENRTLTIREYRVVGAKRLPRLEVEEAVYPYLGPSKTPADVDAARAALEKCYHRRGFETVSVIIPPQDPQRGIIRLEVMEGKVGRLRVNGAKWFLPSNIRQSALSVAEGEVPDMNRVKKDILALNRLADRRVTPVLRAGVEPGSVDIDLNVEDKLPLHGSLELNNRNSADTSGLRLNGSVSYANLFQQGHTLGLDFQVAPQNPRDAKVLSGRYLTRVSDGLSLMLQGSKQDSDISTLGDSVVVGRGHSLGMTALFDLPVEERFYQSLSLAIDYKHSAQNIVIGKKTIATPIEYYPISASYGATWLEDQGFTEFNNSLNFHLRGIGSNELDYSNKRYGADGNYVFIRSDLARTQDLAHGSQLFGKVQSQLASRPLINSDQFSGGGLGTVRGYLESAAAGDNAIFATLEYRTPSLIHKIKDKNAPVSDDWRFHTFAEAGLVGIWEPLPGQQKRTGLASIGAGTRIKVSNSFNGSLDIGVPFISQTGTPAGTPRVTFRSWVEF
jgi:hemolysin activation/secretion protein